MAANAQHCGGERELKCASAWRAAGAVRLVRRGWCGAAGAARLVRRGWCGAAGAVRLMRRGWCGWCGVAGAA